MNSQSKREGGWLTELRAKVGGLVDWFGVFVGALSGISAVARIFQVGLFGVFRDFVAFYRELLHPIYDLINLPPWPFHVPELAVDLLALYAVFVGMGLRAENARASWNKITNNAPLTPVEVAIRSPLLRAILLIPVLSLTPLVNFTRTREGLDFIHAGMALVGALPDSRSPEFIDEVRRLIKHRQAPLLGR